MLALMLHYGTEAGVKPRTLHCVDQWCLPLVVTTQQRAPCNVSQCSKVEKIVWKYGCEVQAGAPEKQIHYGAVKKQTHTHTQEKQ